MEYTLNEIFEKLSNTIDVVYLIDQASDSYTTLKDNTLFHSILGDKGSYNEMMQILLQNTVDKSISKSSPYTVFAETAKSFTGTLANTARIWIEQEELTISISTFPLDDNLSVILIKQLSEYEYLQDIHKNPDLNTIKSAYLYSMKVDLVADTCGNINMSEIDNAPANAPELSYTKWREMILQMIHHEHQQEFIDICNPDFLKENLSYHNSKSIDCLMMNLESKYIWVKILFTRIDTGNDNDFQFLLMIEDINDSHMHLMENLKKYENLATMDSLTELLNRGGIYDAIVAKVEKCLSSNKPISLLMLDIDYFKKVNDTYGHAVGDYVLKTFSSFTSDYLSKFGGEIGRWGGEEFICVLENTNKHQAFDIAESLRKQLADYSFEKIGQITISIGIIEVSPNESPEASFERLDQALYAAKRNGRNQVVC